MKCKLVKNKKGNFEFIGIKKTYPSHSSNNIDLLSEVLDSEVEVELIDVCTYCGMDYCDNLSCRGHHDEIEAKLISSDNFSIVKINDIEYKSINIHSINDTNPMDTVLIINGVVNKLIELT